MKRIPIVITIASTRTHAVWSLSGPFDTALFGFNETHKNTTTSALATALYAMPSKSFLKHVYGRDDAPCSRLPVTVVHASDFVSEPWLEPKLSLFDITLEKVGPDHESIVSLREWAGR